MTANDIPLDDADITRLLFACILVFIQQIGFASLEVGSVRAKNARNILLKNVIDKLLCSLCFWAVGYAFSQADGSNGFAGSRHFFLTNANQSTYALWFYTWVFLLTATTVVSGCIAERAQLEAYMVYTPVMATIIYPLVLHWVSEGWLYTVSSKCIYIDFAGGSTVHLIGGVAGLMGAWVIGPRLGRFDGNPVKPIVGHNVESVVLGTLLLWVGWYGFNIAPAYLRGTEQSAVAVRAAVNTTLAGCSAALTVLGVVWLRTAQYELRALCNGVLAGMVSITALAAHVEPWAAFVLGIAAGFVYDRAAALLVRFHIDDPLDGSAVHGACSIVGILGVGIFANPDFLLQYRGANHPRICGGIVYTGRGWEQLGVQLLGVIVITAFTGAISAALFLGLNHFGRLRVDQATEIAGIDNVDHGGPGYPDFQILSHD